MDLQISNLSKTYPGGIQALDAINLHIRPGLFGLLGPNGSGKSTLMRILATLLEPSQGTVKLGDIDLCRDATQARTLLGYLPQSFGAYPNMSAFEMLDYLATMRGIGPKDARKQRVEERLATVNLYDVRHRRASEFSGGMIRRLGIAQATLNHPGLLLVDEPTTGLDPIERQSFYRYLVETSNQTTVILATHLVEDVRSLCSDMAILGAGKTLAQGHPEDLIRQLQGKIWSCPSQPQQLELLSKQWPIVDTRWSQQELFVDVLSDASPGANFQAKKVALQDAYFAFSKHAQLLDTNYQAPAQL